MFAGVLHTSAVQRPLATVSYRSRSAPFWGAPLSFVNGQLLIDSIELDEVSFADAVLLQILQGDALAGNAFSLAWLTVLAARPGTASFKFLSSVLTDPAESEVNAGLVETMVDIREPGPNGSSGTWLLLAFYVGGLVLVRGRRVLEA